MPIDELNEGETVQDKTVTESCGEISEAQVLPWANVPLFKPAVAVLTCAVIAVGVLALVSPLRERSAEFAVDKPKVQFERLTLRPEFQLPDQWTKKHPLHPSSQTVRLPGVPTLSRRRRNCVLPNRKWRSTTDFSGHGPLDLRKSLLRYLLSILIM